MANMLIDATKLLQVGRPSAPPLDQQQTSLTARQPITLALPFQFNFPQAAGSSFKFGIPRSMYVDNSANAYEVDCTVSNTNDTIPIPAGSAGYYLLDCQDGPNITFASKGDSAGPITITFYNYDKAPDVWYKGGAGISTAITIADGADVAEGSTADAAVTNPATPGTVISFLKGILTQLQTALTVVIGVSATGTQTSVASNVASVTLLALNASRKGATITNDGANNLYVRVGAGAASTVNYTVKLIAGAYYEVPFHYTGAITGIWDVATGSARVSEYT